MTNLERLAAVRKETVWLADVDGEIWMTDRHMMRRCPTGAMKGNYTATTTDAETINGIRRLKALPPAAMGLTLGRLYNESSWVYRKLYNFRPLMARGEAPQWGTYVNEAYLRIVKPEVDRFMGEGPTKPIYALNKAREVIAVIMPIDPIFFDKDPRIIKDEMGWAWDRALYGGEQ